MDAKFLLINIMVLTRKAQRIISANKQSLSIDTHMLE